MKILMTSLIMKFFKVITFIIFICPVSIAFAAVSGFVDNKDITQRQDYTFLINHKGINCPLWSKNTRISHQIWA